MTKKKSKKKRQFKKILNFYENPLKSNVTCPFRVPCAQETPVRLTGCPHSGMALSHTDGWWVQKQNEPAATETERHQKEQCLPRSNFCRLNWWINKKMGNNIIQCVTWFWNNKRAGDRQYLNSITKPLKSSMVQLANFKNPQNLLKIFSFIFSLFVPLELRFSSTLAWAS